MQKKSKSKSSRRGRSNPEQKNTVMRALKGAIFALVITIAAVLIFALIVKQAQLSEDVIAVVNQVIKVGSIFAAALIASRKLPAQRLLAGAMAGGIYVILGYLTFSLIEGEFGDILMLFADLAMGLVIGMLTAAIFGRLGVTENKQATRTRAACV